MASTTRVWSGLVLETRVEYGHATRNNRGRNSGTKVHKLISEYVVGVEEGSTHQPGTVGAKFLRTKQPVLFSCSPACGCTQGQHSGSPYASLTADQVTCSKCMPDTSHREHQRMNTAPVEVTPAPVPVVTPEVAPVAVKEPATYPGKSGPFQWSPTRVTLIKALRALGAVGAANGRSKKDVAAKSKLPIDEVGHYLYKDNDLCTHGFVSYVKGMEGIRGSAYFLTAKGASVKLPS